MRKNHWNTAKPYIREAWRLSLPAILTQITTILMQYIDAAMVGALAARRGRYACAGTSESRQHLGDPAGAVAAACGADGSVRHLAGDGRRAVHPRAADAGAAAHVKVLCALRTGER